MRKYIAAGLLGCSLLLATSPAYLAAGSSAQVESVGSYAMTPIGKDYIEEGTYAVDAQTNSRFFTLHDCTLQVNQDGMEATFYIDSTSYAAVYPGTAAQAAAHQDEQIEAEVKDGKSYFTISVTGLNTPIHLAAYSKSRAKWYDRDILLLASSLPEEALRFSLPDYERIDAALAAYKGETEAKKKEGLSSNLVVLGSTSLSEEKESETEAVKAPEAAATDLADGRYSIEVAMTGGSGRASISSPTLLRVAQGKAYASLTWSSANYDYMIVGGEKFLNEKTDGSNSTFTIPITAFDTPIDIVADTVAMGDPVEINYSLTFYEASIGDEGLIPQIAAMRVLITALAVIIVGGILNYVLKKRKQ